MGFAVAIIVGIAGAVVASRSPLVPPPATPALVLAGHHR
jgi:hypothetical protein